MRIRLQHIVALMLALLALSSCNKTDGFDESLLQLEESALIVNGNQIFTYAPNTCQCSFNRQSKTFRMGTDGMSDYVVAVFEKLPNEVGESVICKTLKWTGKTYLESRTNVEFRVKEIDSEGRIWLWAPSFKMCLVMRVLD